MGPSKSDDHHLHTAWLSFPALLRIIHWNGEKEEVQTSGGENGSDVVDFRIFLEIVAVT